MTNPIFSFLLLIAFTATFNSCKPSNLSSNHTETTKQINQFVSDLHNKGKFNGNILVVKNNQTIFKKSFGYSNGLKERLSEDFKFGIGSIYKEFPAVAIMQLSEQGKLHLNDNISKYLPYLPKWANTVTVKNLLQYSSGLPKVNFGKYFSTNTAIQSENIFNDIKSIENLEFEPGANYIYSNNNPFLLIKIVESISGLAFDTYAKEHLFSPFNLNNTVFKKQYPYTDMSKMAMPINADFKKDPYKINVPSMLLTSTTEDLYNWIKNLHNFKIINSESLHFLTQTANLDNKAMQAPLGDCTLKDRKITTHSHHGSAGNYECLIERDNLNDVTIVILTNQKHGNVFDISKKISKIVDRKAKKHN
ncbi:MAG: beta-lactamase family protein [Flavobacteriaceae bacterium]|nr:beta-lactamase family protein [Flavobacteriaceae bacterium]